MPRFKVKAEKYHDHEWWECEILITTDDEGKVINIEEAED